jgi:hypothetical protein
MIGTMERPVFATPFTPAAADPLRPSQDRRIALRRAVRMPAHLRDRNQTRFELEMIDLSASGFRATTNFALHPGTFVTLTLPGLAPIEAVVAWRERFDYGCTFLRPLHAAVHEHVLDLAARGARAG